MVDTAALESILKEIEHNEGVQEAMLVSLAGTYLAGTFPRGVHVDTFGSMFAVLIGSAETVTSEMKDVLDNVVIHSKASQYLIVHGGRKALLVLRLPLTADPQKAKVAVEKYIPRIEEHL
jgi:predicted regulator of Ras-like GTPase activity (Roadblock/LC7/MglB family)